MKKIILMLGLLVLVIACTPTPEEQALNESGIHIKNCFGIYFTGNSSNVSDYLEQLTFPVKVSLSVCDSVSLIPIKVYHSVEEFPLEDDCYDENRCWVKWNIPMLMPISELQQPIIDTDYYSRRGYVQVTPEKERMIYLECINSTLKINKTMIYCEKE